MRNLFYKALTISLVGLGMLLPPLNAAKTTALYKAQVAVIMYHHIDDDAKSPGTIPVRLFQEQLSFLKSKGFQFITLKQFKDFMQGSSIPNNAVLVTFDDGYESFYENAYPILKNMRIPAVNFVITRDLENPLASFIPSMSRDELVEMTHDTNFIECPVPHQQLSQQIAGRQCHIDRAHDYKRGQRNRNGIQAARCERYTNVCFQAERNIFRNH
jgi:hypothetical protein